MASPTDTSRPMPDLDERSRRRPGAAGVPVRLADGQAWLFASPTFRAGRPALTEPPIDRPLDRIFERLALHDSVLLQDVWEVAIALTRGQLRPGPMTRSPICCASRPARRVASSSMPSSTSSSAPEAAGRSYSDWVRASLLANGLDAAEIPANVLPNVLAVLIATRRAVPVARFVDACRAADARSSLESLI